MSILKHVNRSVRRCGLLAMVPMVMMAAFSGGCSTQQRLEVEASDIKQRGVASYYADEYHGRATASGERFDMHDMTGAHRSLPFGARVQVKNLDNGKTAVVRINDRGPFVRGRVIDLSYAAARRIGMIRAGLADVELRVLETPEPLASAE